ncbi:hypothetical protein ACP4OV_028779 [Aristida adscensionis]
MQTGETRPRFGRCPYCRAVVYHDDAGAAVFYCSRCRTPIRGKNRPEPTADGAGGALDRLEILSADAASVFSDELEACHVWGSVPDVDGNFTANGQGIAPSSSSSPNRGGLRSARQVHSVSNGVSGVARRVDVDGPGDSDEQAERRPASRRTRRPSSYDPSVLRYGLLMSTDPEMGEGFSSPRNAGERRRWRRQRRRLLMGSQELETSSVEPPGSGAAASPLANPAFHRELLHALDSLRGLVAAVEPTASPSGARAAAAVRRDARLFRRLESRLAGALPAEEHHRPRGNATSRSTTGSPDSSAGGRNGRPRKHHCRPVLGGAPFVVCGACSALLQAPAATSLSRRRRRRGATTLRCGGCEQVVELTVPAAAAGVACSGRRVSNADSGGCSGGRSGDGAPEMLYHVLGYSSPSPLLQSRRY